MLDAANARVEAVMARHEAQLARQRALADRLSFLSPALLMYRYVADLAGAGDRRHAQFLARSTHSIALARFLLLAHPLRRR